MYRFAGLFVGLVGVVLSVKADAEERECFETVLNFKNLFAFLLAIMAGNESFLSLFPIAISKYIFNGMCCQFNLTDEKVAKIKECTESTVFNPRTCDFQTCFAQKSGYLLPNGTVDMTAFLNFVEEDFQNYPDIKDIIMEKCINADNLEIYGPPGMCHLKKILNCLRMHSLLNCPQWEDSDHCSKIRDKIADCESVYP